MASVHPLILGGVAHLLRRRRLQRPTAFVLSLLGRTGTPLTGVERSAARRPDPAFDPEHDANSARALARLGLTLTRGAHGVLHASPIQLHLSPLEGATTEGPLAGETVVVKDSIDVAGEYSSLGLLDGGDRATDDAEVVTRIRNAGGVLIGKAKMTELGMDGLGALIYGAMAPNPKSPGYFAGGSSTGTAVAVASGLARYGVGGDGMGSVRIPAAFCGLVGLKPTRDRLPSRGYGSPAPSMDVPGPMARNTTDCARLFHVMAGEAPVTLTARAPARIGVVRELGPELACRSIQKAFHRALRVLASPVESVSIPGAGRNTILGSNIGTGEIARSAFGTRGLSAAGRLNVSLGLAFTTDDVRVFERQRAALREATLRALARVTVLAMPTTAVPAPAVTQALLDGAQDLPLLLAVGAYTPLANLCGLPAIAVPSGVDDRGRSLSIMFVGSPGSEDELLRIALALEATGVGELLA